MSANNSDRPPKDPLAHRARYAKHREHILAWRKNPEQVAKQKAYKAKNRERYNEANRRHRIKFSELYKAKRRTPDARAKRRAISRKSQLAQYGLTQSSYDALLIAQNGRCAICKTDKPGGRHNQFHIDHSHETGHVRGLLCVACNHGIGHFGDHAAIVFVAAQYLLRGAFIKNIA